MLTFEDIHLHRFICPLHVLSPLGWKLGIPRGIPNMLMNQNKRTRHIPPSVLPSPDEAAQMYRDNGGRLTDPAQFGNDPRANCNEKKLIRESYFKEKYPCFQRIFHQLVNGEDTPFRHALLSYCDIIRRLSRS